MAHKRKLPALLFRFAIFIRVLFHFSPFFRLYFDNAGKGCRCGLIRRKPDETGFLRMANTKKTKSPRAPVIAEAEPNEENNLDTNAFFCNLFVGKPL